MGGKSTPPAPGELQQLLRYPDISAVVDLSRVPIPEKREYLHSLLPMLASHRQTTGLPHRIVIDEAHYFLHEPNVRQLLDLELGAYTLVTYRPSDLHPELRKAIDVVAATRTTDAQSLDAIAAMCGKSSAELKTVIEGLAIDEAAILPGPVTGGKLLPFKLLPRLTPHVRHRVKYFDVPVGEGRGFVFTSNGIPVGAPACSLREFVSALASLSPEILDGHAQRDDFSRWISDVFRDHPLSSRVRKVEEQYRLGHIRDLRHALTSLVRERYDLPSNINVPG
jgi:hypothetical protein